MNISNIIQEIFQQKKLEDVSLEQIQALTQEQPFFATAHFLLLKKMQQTSHPEFKTQLHKAALHFDNPLWLGFLLQPSVNELSENIQASAREQAKVSVNIKEEEAVAPQPAVDKKEEQLTHTEAINYDSEVINVHNNETLAMSTKEPTSVSTPVSDTALVPQQEELIFEPYHTIDYFASLGIKVGKNVPLNDKLGNQLKSFTEWLKTLKKLPETTLPVKLDADEDQPMPDEKVEAMAATSLKEKETLTESMAEVLLKQGKKETAIEMYNKLSLLNPDKSHYFAAKIEALKQN